MLINAKIANQNLIHMQSFGRSSKPDFLLSQNTSTISEVTFSKEQTKQQDKKSNDGMSTDTKILLAVGGLATIALAGVLIAKNKGSKVVKETEDTITSNIKSESIEDLTKKKKELIKKFQELPKEEWQKIPEEDRKKTEDLFLTMKKAKNQVIPEHHDKLINLSSLFEIDKKGQTTSIPNIIMVHSKEIENIEDTIKLLPNLTGIKIQEIKGTNVMEELKKCVQNPKDRQLIYIPASENFFKKATADEITEFNTFLKDCADKHKITVICDTVVSENNSKIHETVSKNNGLKIEAKPWEWTKEKEATVVQMTDITEETEKKYGLFKNYLGEVPVLKQFFEIELPMERVRNKPFHNITNAIMLEGNDEEGINSVMAILPQMSDLNLAKVTHSNENPNQTIENLYEEAEKAEKHFQATKQRTILRMNNIEELLSDKTDEGARRIADFKSFEENCSKDYHVTLLFKIKNAEKIDPAAIAPHRVGIRLGINKKD